MDSSGFISTRLISRQGILKQLWVGVWELATGNVGQTKHPDPAKRGLDHNGLFRKFFSNAEPKNSKPSRRSHTMYTSRSPRYARLGRQLLPVVVWMWHVVFRAPQTPLCTYHWILNSFFYLSWTPLTSHTQLFVSSMVPAAIFGLIFQVQAKLELVEHSSLLTKFEPELENQSTKTKAHSSHHFRHIW